MKDRQGRARQETQGQRRVRTDLDAPTGVRGPLSAPHPAPVLTRRDYQLRLGELLARRSTHWQHRQDWQHRIGEEVLESSSVMDGANFRRIARLDLERMSEAYDRYFFQGLCLPLARSYGMTFRLSSRMSRAGGKTTRRMLRAPNGQEKTLGFEITLSTSLLFQSFRKPGDQARVCGLPCDHRLAAMQRVVEHEMIHLCEMLVWIHSDCNAQRFQSISQQLFGHTEHRHELVTQYQRAARDFNIRPGQRVAFRCNGKTLNGVVNRITSRATVLVPDPKGSRYNDGFHYTKYYVPLDQMRPIG